MSYKCWLLQLFVSITASEASILNGIDRVICMSMHYCLLPCRPCVSDVALKAYNSG